jgi:hypothetical protein
LARPTPCRLERQIALTGDERLADLHAEVLRYPGPEPDQLPSAGDVMVKLELACADGPLTFFSTVTTFGTAVDITLAELSIEAFFPADAKTAEALQATATTA